MAMLKLELFVRCMVDLIVRPAVMLVTVKVWTFPFISTPARVALTNGPMSVPMMMGLAPRGVNAEMTRVLGELVSTVCLRGQDVY